jgi:hypothetical protein
MISQIKQFISRYINIIILGLVVVGAVIAYNVFYLGPNSESDDAGAIRAENQAVASSEIGREIVTTLNRLKSITIDPDFFTEERFQRLVDFSVDIQEQPVGKNNPFNRSDIVSGADITGEVAGTDALQDAVEVDAADETDQEESTDNTSQESAGATN